MMTCYRQKRQHVYLFLMINDLSCEALAMRPKYLSLALHLVSLLTSLLRTLTCIIISYRIETLKGRTVSSDQPSVAVLSQLLTQTWNALLWPSLSNPEDHKGFGALHPQFWRARTATVSVTLRHKAQNPLFFIFFIFAVI